MSWLVQFFGMDNGSGAPYLFWSGVGSDIGEVALIGAVIGMYHRHNCHVDGCLRLGRHHVEGTPYVVCRRHHPGITSEITHEVVKLAHEAHRRASRKPA